MEDFFINAIATAIIEIIIITTKTIIALLYIPNPIDIIERSFIKFSIYIETEYPPASREKSINFPVL